MQKWSIPVLIAIIALLMPMFSATVSAQGEASFCIDKTPDKWAVRLTNTIAHTDNTTSGNVTMTKAEILKLSGVPGKGIKKAPGLQKLFNPKSQAAEHAGKKNRDKKEEQLQIRQMTENHGATKGQLKIRQRVENQP